MSRAQKLRIQSLQARLDVAERNAGAYRKAFREGGDLHAKALTAAEERHRAERDKAESALRAAQQHHQFEIDALRRDHADLLDNLLLLEPHLKHYQTENKGPWSLGGTVWDRERIIRAANHLRGEQALESLGYTNEPAPWPDNVTPIGFYHGNRGDLPDDVA